MLIAKKHNPAEVQVMEVIRTTLGRRGRGTSNDPHRIIEQFWTLDGELLAEKDSGLIRCPFYQLGRICRGTEYSICENCDVKSGEKKPVKLSVHSG